ncbi:adenosine deaminase [Synechococcus elongatus IITB7]|uniref:adenosine deaminase n=1 Tax=Synechococcus elongatus TaxID=32046 RepID=UPI0030D051AE
MALFADLHRHLGGAVVPRILWRYLQRSQSDLLDRFTDYSDFEEFYTAPKASLAEYLEIHKLVESTQSAETLPYFIQRLVRGAYTFENLAYLELRYTPYLRTPAHLSQADRIALMPEVIHCVAEASQVPGYPLLMPQILCLHTHLPYEVNRAMVQLAAEFAPTVCAIDVAGGDRAYAERLPEFIELFNWARELGLKTTGHLFETRDGCYPELLPYLMRIGHGIQIPLHYPELLPELAARGQCLEVCPTTYIQTGTLTEISALRTVFDRCFEAGVDIVICTDNAGLHNVRLPAEYEALLTADVIDFQQLQACQTASFRHAFAWPHSQPPSQVLQDWLRQPSAPAIA